MQIMNSNCLNSLNYISNFSKNAQTNVRFSILLIAVQHYFCLIVKSFVCSYSNSSLAYYFTIDIWNLQRVLACNQFKFLGKNMIAKTFRFHSFLSIERWHKFVDFIKSAGEMTQSNCECLLLFLSSCHHLMNWFHIFQRKTDWKYLHDHHHVSIDSANGIKCYYLQCH